VRRALTYEVARQIEALGRGEKLEQERAVGMMPWEDLSHADQGKRT